MTDRDWARLGVLYHQWRQEQARHVTLVHEFSVEELKSRGEYWKSYNANTMLNARSMRNTGN